MTRRVYVTPRNGKIIPMPDGNGDLPQQGKEVTLNSFWYKREADKDVTFGPAPAVAAVPTETPPAVVVPAEVPAAKPKAVSKSSTRKKK